MAPRRATLTRERILSTALAVVDRDGMGGLTIRALATDLGVTPMAVYRHVQNKGEIVDGLLDEVIRVHLESEPLSDPKPWLFRRFCRIQEAMVAHPAVLPLLGQTGSYGPGALRCAEEILSALHAGGLSPEASATAFHELLGFTIGAAALGSAAAQERSDRTDTEAWLEQRRTQFEALSLESHPHVLGSAHALVRFAAPALFRDGLRRILDRLPLR